MPISYLTGRFTCKGLDPYTTVRAAVEYGIIAQSQYDFASDKALGRGNLFRKTVGVCQ